MKLGMVVSGILLFLFTFTFIMNRYVFDPTNAISTNEIFHRIDGMVSLDDGKTTGQTIGIVCATVLLSISLVYLFLRVVNQMIFVEKS